MVTLSDQLWGEQEGKEIHLFKMENSSGAYVELTNYGGTLVSVVVPDRNGALGNVVFGYPVLKGYLEDNAYIGSTVGRFANRIANARFAIDGRVYQLEDNDNGHCNHSAGSGFHARVFEARTDGDQLIFTLYSEDGAGGFPGNLTLNLRYRWTENNSLLIIYDAESDQKTVVNFTNHAYFNLSAKNEKIFDHVLTIDADEVLEANADYIPTGKILPAGPIAFQQNQIRERICSGEQIKGLNVCYVLKDKSNLTKSAAVLSDPGSGRTMEVFTSYPGLMLYTGDYLNTAHYGHLGLSYQPFDGLCLECQFYPDSPNHPAFPSSVLKPGEIYQHSIEFQFSNTQDLISK